MDYTYIPRDPQGDRKRKLEIRKIKSDMLLSWAGFAAVVFGAILGFNEYLSNKEKVRIDRVLSFVEKIQEDNVASADDHLRDFWIDRAGEIKEVRSRSDEDEWSLFVLKHIDDHGLHEMIHELTEFYELLAICVFKTLCDETTAFSLFGKKMSAFYFMHNRYIVRLRDQIHDDAYAGYTHNFSVTYRKRLKGGDS